SCAASMLAPSLECVALRADRRQAWGWSTVCRGASMRTRREILAVTAAALAMPSVVLAEGEPPKEPAKPKQLVFNASGGSQIPSLRENYINDFERETGIRVVDTSPVDFGKLRAMVESGNVSWNITEIGGQDGFRVTELGLAEPIDDKIVDRSKFQPQA